MLVVDERKLSQSTIEAIGHNYGISDTGYDFEEYPKLICKLLQVKKKKGIDSKLVGKLKLCGLRVYLFSLTGKEMNVREYAEWLGKELTVGVRQDFTKGIDDLNEKRGDAEK